MASETYFFRLFRLGGKTDGENFPREYAKFARVRAAATVKGEICRRNDKTWCIDDLDFDGETNGADADPSRAIKPLSNGGAALLATVLACTTTATSNAKQRRCESLSYVSLLHRRRRRRRRGRRAVSSAASHADAIASR